MSNVDKRPAPPPYSQGIDWWTTKVAVRRAATTKVAVLEQRTDQLWWMRVKTEGAGRPYSWTRSSRLWGLAS